MGLQNLAEQLGSFNPKEDKINAGSGNGLPAGEYEVTVEDATHKTFRSGWDCFGFDLSVVAGEYAGSKEQVNLSFAEVSKSGKAIPDFVLERNAKTVMTLGALMGVQVTVDNFLLPNETDIHERLNELLHGHIGAMVHMTITEKPNKKDPNNPFKEYEFSEPQTTMETPEVSDNDLPFGNTDEINVEDDDLPF